jgi:predicted lipid-binding transport protein (Tim44 family)
MDGQINFVMLIALIVAAVAIWKLKSVLGSRTDEDDARVERLRARDRENARHAAGGATGEVINMPRRERDASPAATVAAGTLADGAEARIKAYAAVDASVTGGLLAIAKFDPTFDPDAFLTGAGSAYELIVSAFAAGNRKALKDLLSREVYEGFVAAISEREGRAEQVDQQFVGISRSDIVEAEAKNGIAYITVRFVSQLITATRDKAGQLISGDPQKIKEVTDIWTFNRDVSSRKALENLNWRLVATQAPN